MRPVLLYLTVVLLLSGTALLHGHWTDRWTERYDPEAITQLLERLPAAIGDWDAQSNEVEDTTVRQMIKRPHLLRHYVNRVNGRPVILFISADRHGPLLVNHTPDNCYLANGYSQVGTLEKHSVSLGSAAAAAEFSVARFTKNDAVIPPYVRVFWSWSGSGQGLVSAYPPVTVSPDLGLFRVNRGLTL